MTPQNHVQLAALAGLLHDIGNFALRAGVGGRRLWNDTTRQTFKYQHAMLSADFVEGATPQAWRNDLTTWVGQHHQPSGERTAEALAVILADLLSAAGPDDNTHDKNTYNKSAHGEDERSSHPRQLQSIFAHLNADERQLNEAERTQAFLPLQPMTLAQDAIFPTSALDEDAAWAAYAKLYADFTRDTEQLAQAHQTTADLAAYLESMLLLMQRYTWAIPAAQAHGAPSTSLYDHSHTTAALAAVLTASAHDAATLQQWIETPQTTEEVALLVGADLSGVQEFIYTITSRGATSALRGRSFYLQLLTEAAARFILRELKLPITNLLYAGGGNFYLLAAPHHADALPAIQQQLSQVLLQHHRGDLYIALASAPVRGMDFFGGRVGRIWQRLTECLQRAKLRRFAELSPAQHALIFAPQEDGGNEDKQCQVCGLEHPYTEAIDGVRKCPPCRSYEKLGRDLRRARFLLLAEVEAPPADLSAPPDTYEGALAMLGMCVKVEKELPSLPSNRATLLALHDEAWAELRPQSELAVGRRFLVNTTPILTSAQVEQLRGEGYVNADNAPLLAGQVKPFDLLANDSQGIKRLGVLRMDVDNLGRLFAEGLGELATISRVVSLSHAISLYFEGWVGEVAQEFTGRIYSIYSGGDDLFFVGAWDAIVEFARRVRADFTPYAAHHPGLHLSAGITLAGGKYPLAQAARDAGEAEEAAKAYQGVQGQRKDAIAFLGAVQPWKRFGLEAHCTGGTESVHMLMHLLSEITAPNEDGRHVPRALLGNLVQLYDQYLDEWEERRRAGRDLNRGGEAQALWGPWMWRGVYMLSHMADRLQHHPSQRQQIQQLHQHLEQEEFRNMDWIGLAARWAELISR